MLRRFRLVLIALAVALVTTLPTGLRAMPMPAFATGTAIQPPCTGCTDHTRSNPGHPGMPACPLFACIGTAATLPAGAPLPSRVLRPAAYAAAPHLRWRSALPDPNPIPPRPVPLV